MTRKPLSIFFREDAQVWLKLLERGSNKKRFQYFLDSDGIFCICVSSKASLEEIELSYHCRIMCEIVHDWVEYINHVGSSISCSSIIQSGLIAGGKNWKEGRQTVSFTTVDPMNEPQRDEPYDVKEPQEVLCRKFWRTTSNAVILDNSVPADCLEKEECYRTGEVLYQKIRLSPRLPPKVILNVFGNFDTRERRNQLQSQ